MLRAVALALLLALPRLAGAWEVDGSTVEVNPSNQIKQKGAGVGQAWVGSTPTATDVCTQEEFDGVQVVAGLGDGAALDCSRGANDTADVRSLLETGGAAAGGRLHLPAGCQVLLGTPGAGDAVAELPTGTEITCGANAGFFLARRYCSTGDVAGASCSDSDDCQGGTCTTEGGGQFAPSDGSVYTVFSAASASSRQRIRGCHIWVNQLDGAEVQHGGLGHGVGVCTGGADDGESCFAHCAGGVMENQHCNSDSDCPSSTCTNASHCGTDSTCAPRGYSNTVAPAGPGDVVPIDFANATDVEISDVTISDHRFGAKAIETGENARIVRTDTQAMPGGAWVDLSTATLISFDPTRKVEMGVKVGRLSRLEKVIAGAYATVFDLNSSVLCDGCEARCRGYGDEAQTDWEGNIGFSFSGGQYARVEASTVEECFSCLHANHENILYFGNYCDGGDGPKFILNNVGTMLWNNRGSWGSATTVFSFGDQRGWCDGGSRDALVCLQTADAADPLGCPSGTCDSINPDNSSQYYAATDPDHNIIVGNAVYGSANLIAGDNPHSIFSFAQGKRCQNGTPGKECSIDSDCGFGGICDDSLTAQKMQINNNYAFGMSTGGTFFDFTGLAEPGAIAKWQAYDNWMEGGGYGIKWPSTSGVFTGVNVIQGDFASPTVFDSGTVPWDAIDISRATGQDKDDAQPIGVANFVAGETVSAGHALRVDTSTTSGHEGRVLKATNSVPEATFAFAMHDASSAAAVKVCVTGVCPCLAGGTIANGDALMIDSTAGRVKVAGSTDRVVARAVSDATVGNALLCVLNNNAPVDTYPKVTESTVSGASTSIAVACTAEVQLTTVAPTTTTGHKMVIRGHVTVSNTAGSGGVRDFQIQLQRGGSGCDSGSPTTLTPLFQGSAGQGQKVAIAGEWVEASPNGTVTYRLCGCVSTGSTASVVVPETTLVATEF